MKLNIQINWQDHEIAEDVIELSEDKFAPLSEEETEAAIETIIRNYMNQHLAVRWELEE